MGRRKKGDQPERVDNFDDWVPKDYKPQGLLEEHTAHLVRLKWTPVGIGINWIDPATKFEHSWPVALLLTGIFV